ncbi:alanine-glyoxylate aminotransferase 2, isoform CRA_e [Rattus norvegicus]|nr:alanine-glyoxylate aminotransferase 2, isoform CRA_e [Rattus norvegicus]
MSPEVNPFRDTTSGQTFFHASAQMPLVTLETSASHDAVSQFTPGTWKPCRDKAWSLYYAGNVVGS